jgi:hypothetical protein
MQATKELRASQPSGRASPRTARWNPSLKAGTELLGGARARIAEKGRALTIVVASKTGRLPVGKGQPKFLTVSRALASCHS